MRPLAFSCSWLTARLGSLHPDTATDPEGQIGPPSRLFQIHYENGKDVASRLRTLGLEPELWRTLPQAPRELT